MGPNETPETFSGSEKGDVLIREEGRKRYETPHHFPTAKHVSIICE